MSSVTLLYHPDSDQNAMVRDLEYNYRKQTGKVLDKLSLETIQGAEMARLYGVVQYPAIIAKDTNGIMIRMWEGSNIPLVSEISFYDQQPQHMQTGN